MRDMKKLFILLLLVVTSFTLIAQPILPSFKLTTNVYSPKMPVKPVIGPRGPRGYRGIPGVPGLQGVPGEDAKMAFKATAPTLTSSLKDTVVNINNYFMTTINPIKVVYAIDPVATSKLYMKKGTGKIIAGLSMQAAAVGLVAFASIPRYQFKTIETTKTIDYTYNEYKLEPVGHGKHHKHQKYTLQTIVKTGQIEVTDVDQVVEQKHVNKNAYYIGAGILSLAGAALEVSGIIDLHNTKMYLTQNSIGFIKTF